MTNQQSQEKLLRERFEAWALENLPANGDDKFYCNEDIDPFEIFEAGYRSTLEKLDYDKQILEYAKTINWRE